LIKSEGWDISKRAIKRHPIIVYLTEEKKKESEWLCKEETSALTKPQRFI
jgi:hypothetical protein